MIESIQKVQTIEAVTCSVCGTVFGLESFYRASRLSDRQEFFCPNGHRLSYHETEVVRLKKAIEFWVARAREQERITRRERKLAQSMKGQVTRIRNRIAAGVCPDCNRTFRNLARHMKCKHGAKP